MQKKKFVLGLALFILGLFFIINSQINITGAVIGVSLSFNFSSIISILFIFGGLILFMVDEGEESDLERSVKEAIDKGVPKNESIKIFKDSNKKVESGEWVELEIERVANTSNPDHWPDATSLCRYWGPEEYKGQSKNKLQGLYRSGKIGKTHELLRGSDVYKLKKYEKDKKEISFPAKGSRVLHRYWEIYDMYKYHKRSET